MRCGILILVSAGKTKADDELLTIITPCMNEERLVGATIDEIMEVAPTLPVRLEVVMVDDGSTDGTRAEMERLCEKYPNVRMKVQEKNLGISRSVYDTVEELDPNSWVSCFPGDHEMVFQSIRGFLAIRDDYDLILGYLQNSVVRTIPRRVGSAAFTTVARGLYGFPWRYLNGIKLYRASTFSGIRIVSGGHAANAELIAKAQLRNPKLRIGEAPFVARGRSVGESKAFRPASVVEAVKATYMGYRSVVAFRHKHVRSDDEGKE